MTWTQPLRTLPLATRADLDAALPPPPTEGAVADWQRVRRALATHRNQIAAELGAVSSGTEATALVHAVLAGADPADHEPSDWTTRPRLEHHLAILDLAVDITQRRLTDAQQRDGHWQAYRARCADWLDRWRNAHAADPDARPYLLAELAAELEAASAGSDTP